MPENCSSSSALIWLVSGTATFRYSTARDCQQYPVQGSQFPSVLFSCLPFLNSADPTISEPGTGYVSRGIATMDLATSHPRHRRVHIDVTCHPHCMFVDMREFFVHFRRYFVVSPLDICNLEAIFTVNSRYFDLSLIRL